MVSLSNHERTALQQTPRQSCKIRTKRSPSRPCIVPIREACSQPPSSPHPREYKPHRGPPVKHPFRHRQGLLAFAVRRSSPFAVKPSSPFMVSLSNHEGTAPQQIPRQSCRMRTKRSPSTTRIVPIREASSRQTVFPAQSGIQTHVRLPSPRPGKKPAMPPRNPRNHAHPKINLIPVLSSVEGTVQTIP